MNDLITSQKYLDGELSEQECLDFEINLESNGNLLKEINLIKEIDHFFMDKERVGYEQQVRKLLVENRDSKRLLFSPIGISHKYLLAASIILLLGVFAYMYNIKTQSESDKLFASYYEKYDPDVFRRSDTSAKDPFTQALHYYVENEYNTAANLLTDQLKQDPGLVLARYYLGLCYMELEEYQLALDQFGQISEKNSVIQHHSAWYSALAYIKLDQSVEASLLLKNLAQSDGFYQEQAQQLLDAI
jgi:tetratricopeptide (TPR) repeat protein